MNRPHAIVIGGGIGGLAAAAGLRRIGWSVVVLERAATLSEVGAGISLMANAQRALDELGVGAAVRAAAATMLPGGEGVRTPSGRRLMRGPNPTFVRGRGLSVAVLLRAELQRILREALPDDCVRTGTDVTWYVSRPAAAEVVCRVGRATRVLTGDVVVAADGLNSKARRQMWPDHLPVYSGHGVWRGVTRTPVPWAEAGGNTWGRGQQFGRMPLADGRAYWYAVANTPPGRRRSGELDEVRRRFGSWHWPIPALIGATAPETVLHHDIYELARPLPASVSGRVALLGDAAHAMTSDLGQGACQALEDAAVLCASLAAGPDVRAALERYDIRRRTRVQMITEASRRMGRLTLLEHRLAVVARNVVARMVPPQAGRRALLEIADWHPPAVAEVVHR